MNSNSVFKQVTQKNKKFFFVHIYNVYGQRYKFIFSMFLGRNEFT